MSLQGWRRLRSRVVLERLPWLRVFEDDFELPDGRRIDGFLRLESRDTAQVVAITAEQRVVLVRQYKPGLERVAIQAPAGYVEAGEAPDAAARRELLEETGFAAERWDTLGAFGADGNRGFGTTHLYLAHEAVRVPEAQLDPEEQLEIIEVPLAEVYELLTSGQVIETGPAACLALALLRLTAAPLR